MTRKFVRRGIVGGVAIAVFCYVLGFYQQTSAAPRPVEKPARAIGQPLADAVRLQSEMLNELKAIRSLLEKQNALLGKRAPDGETDSPAALPRR